VTIGVLVIGAIVVAAVVLMTVAGRRDREQLGRVVDAVEPGGLVVDGELVEWSAVFEVALLTRKELAKTWFGFEIRTETHGLLTLDGTGDGSGDSARRQDSGGMGQAFLAECHRFPGFDHAGVTEGLTSRSARVVCFSR
jgi:hypothetical protein